jgi:hypothetical protein
VFSLIWAARNSVVRVIALPALAEGDDVIFKNGFALPSE